MRHGVGRPRTRRYHGWYVPAIPPPRRRWMMVSGCEEFVTCRGSDRRTLDAGLSGRDFAGRDGEPVAIPARALPDLAATRPSELLDRTLALPRARPIAITVVRWTNRGTRPRSSCASGPLLALRGLPPPPAGDRGLGPTTEVRGETSLGAAAGLPAPPVPPRRLRRRRAWTRSGTGTSATRRKARGYDSEEDLWSPLEWEWTLRPDAQAFALFSLDEVAGDPDRLLDAERRRRDEFARTGDSGLRRARAAAPSPSWSRRTRTGADDSRGLPVAVRLGAPGDDRRARARAGAWASAPLPRRSSTRSPRSGGMA